MRGKRRTYFIRIKHPTRISEHTIIASSSFFPISTIFTIFLIDQVKAELTIVTIDQHISTHIVTSLYVGRRVYGLCFLRREKFLQATKRSVIDGVKTLLNRIKFFFAHLLVEIIIFFPHKSDTSNTILTVATIFYHQAVLTRGAINKILTLITAM